MRRKNHRWRVRMKGTVLGGGTAEETVSNRLQQEKAIGQHSLHLLGK